MATFLGIYHLCLDPHVKWDINTARDNDEGIWSSHIKSGWRWDRLEDMIAIFKCVKSCHGEEGLNSLCIALRRWELGEISRSHRELSFSSVEAKYWVQIT